MLDRHAILAGAKEAFFKAMLAGYTGNGDGSIKTRGLDGEVTIEFVDGDYRVLDRYYVTPGSDRSAGTTTIFFKNNPVWWMSYGGYYPKITIPFLKAALGQAYREGKFYGGRGPYKFEEGIFVYKNSISRGDFSWFAGEEIIQKEGYNGRFGCHRYSGMGLI